MALDIATTLQQTERLMNAGNLREAKQLCRQLVDENDGLAQGWRLLGQINGNLKSYDEAAACFRRAIDIVPHDPASHFFLGMSLLGAKRSTEAVAAFRRTLEMQPNHAPAHARLGESLHQESRFAEAQASYEAALALDSGNALLHCNLGVSLRELNACPAALQQFQYAARLDPGNAEIQIRLNGERRGRRLSASAQP